MEKYVKYKDSDVKWLWGDNENVLLNSTIYSYFLQEVKPPTKENWGAKVLDTVSERLQQELHGLRGFSASNLKKMRLFYKAWKTDSLISSVVTNQIDEPIQPIGSLPTNQIETERELINYLTSVYFTHHFLCKEKYDKKVEYCFRDFSKPMGVATYKTSQTLPPELQKALPDAETLKKLLD